MLALFSGIPLFWYGADGAVVAFRTMILPALAGLCGIVCVSLACYMFSGVRSRTLSILRAALPDRWKGADMEAALERLSTFRIGSSMGAQILGLSVLFQCLMITRVYLLCWGSEVHLGLPDVAWISSLVLLLQILPFFFAGIGIREGAYAYLFTLLGLQPEKGVLVGLLFFSQMLIFAALGGVCEMLEK
jgi:uncharacterized membrane protein YbhN (UPF0104 family)